MDDTPVQNVLCFGACRYCMQFKLQRRSINPTGKNFSQMSTIICLPTSVSKRNHSETLLKGIHTSIPIIHYRWMPNCNCPPLILLHILMNSVILIIIIIIIT